MTGAAVAVVDLAAELDGALPQLLLDSVVDYAIFFLDADGNVLTWNPGAERIKGWTREEIVGRNFSMFYTPEDITLGKPSRMLEEAAAVGRSAGEGWRLRKDGTAFWADVVVTALRDPDGRLVGFAKVTRDSTERKYAVEADRALIALQEREAIGRDLHQSVIRMLFGIGLSLQAGADTAGDDRLRARLEAAVKELDDAITELRSHVVSNDRSHAPHARRTISASRRPARPNQRAIRDSRRRSS